MKSKRLSTITLTTKEEQSKSGLGFVRTEEDELKVKVSNDEIDKIIKEYKKIKKSERSNFSQIKNLVLLIRMVIH